MAESKNIDLKIMGGTLAAGGVYGLIQGRREFYFTKDGQLMYIPKWIVPVVSGILVGIGGYLLFKK